MKPVAILLAGSLTLAACAPSYEALVATAIPAPTTLTSFMADRAVPDVDMPATRHPGIVAFSGGGPDGAFGAGYITARLRSANFAPDVMTGVSIGAMVATLAFVNMPDRLEALFAEGGLEGMSGDMDPIRGLLGASFSSGERYAQAIAATLDDQVLARVAEEHAQGRRLYVAVTDLDTMQPAVWDLGALAAAGAYEFARQVVLASGSIPGAFPPVALADGTGDPRLYVDGGTTAQFYVPDFRPGHAPRDVLVVINNALDGDPVLPSYSALAIVQRGFSTLIRAEARDLIEIERLKLERTGGRLHVVALPEDAPATKVQDFTAEAMREMFMLGQEVGARS